jgi:TrbL/VirB6 plasmid conjugal transfer protein
LRRRLAWVAAATLALVLLAWPAALGEYRGSDLLGNIAPESQAGGGLVDRHPLSAYALDYHVDVGLTEPEGVPPMIAQWAASQLWSATSFLVRCVIDLFTWAFSLDLLGGADGALAPISDAITSLYENVIGEAWMVAGILIAGLWGIWKALVQRRYTETAGALGVSILFVLIALFFVYQPERTVGEASRWTNTLSLAFLSGANRGSLDDPEQAKHQVADHLFETLIYRPWVVLEFGGLSHCVDTGRLDDDGFPTPVGPHDAARDVCRDHVEAGADGFGGYAPRYLRQAPGSEARKAEYDALRTGEAPRDDPQFAGFRVDKADSPAVDIQQAGGSFQRLTFAVVIFLGALGAVVLLGTLSLAVILAQVVALVLLGFAPVALIVGIFPRAGHDFFRAWLTKLATAIFIKALYSLVIAIVMAVSAALSAATGSLGFLFAFGLQTLFFWALFVYRKQITARLVAATTGGAHHEGLPRASVIQRGAAAATAPVSALVGFGRRGGSEEDGQQESALTGAQGGTAPPRPPAAGGAAAGAPRPAPTPGPGRGALTAGDPLRGNGSGNGNGASPRPAAPARAAVEVRQARHEPTPRESHEAVMRRVLEEYERRRRAAGDAERRG